MSEIAPFILPCIAVLALVVGTVFLWHLARRQQSQVIDTVPAADRPPVDSLIQDQAIQALSARLASVEGRIGVIAATLESVAVLNGRVAAIETNMPAVQEAYEKYADQISRADKRDTERARRNMKDQGMSAGEAAAALTGGAGAGGTPPTQPAPPQNNKTPRPGVIGRGGRGR